VCFLDLTGYTRLTEERGDAAAAELAARLAGLVRRSALEHGGTPVKWLGDGVMFYFRAPAAAVLAAVEMVEVVGRHGLPRPMWGSTRGRSSSRRVTILGGR
jgi:adenylate cyclase